MALDKFVPASELLVDMRLLELPEGYIPLDVVVLIKCMDPDPDTHKPVWCTRYTEALSSVETLGAIHAALLLEETHLRSIYQCDTDEAGD